MISIFALFAAAICFFGAFFHGVVGRRIYLGNIRDAKLTARTASLSTVAWDMFTVLLLVCGLALAHVAFFVGPTAMLYPIVAMNALGGALFIGLALAGHTALFRMPGAYLMIGVAVFAAAAIYWPAAA